MASTTVTVPLPDGNEVTLELLMEKYIKPDTEATVAVVPLTDENRPFMAEFALSMYANEPCRICRQMLTMADLKDGAVFAQYSVDGTARAAHRVCWGNFVELLRTLPVERIHQLMNGTTEQEPS